MCTGSFELQTLKKKNHTVSFTPDLKRILYWCFSKSQVQRSHLESYEKADLHLLGLGGAQESAFLRASRGCVLLVILSCSLGAVNS